MKQWLFVLIFGLIFIPSVARADVSLLVLEAVGYAGEYTGSGHTAIYLSNICADGPIALRMCRAGEKGVVISSYPSFVKGENYRWMAIPLIPYLYGVEGENEIPLYANGEVRNFLRESYRRNHLSSLVRGHENGAIPAGEWKIMLTAAFNRDIYALNVQTTIKDDERFLLEFNKLPNHGNFNSFTRNCADFSRKLLNRFFPGAARRDVINDFAITTPKAVARSFSRYIKKQPERLFHITRYTQVAGPIWRSFDNRNFTEMAFKSKKYLIPSLIFDPPLVPIFAGAYLLTGRFDLHNTYREFPSPSIARLKLDKFQLNDPRRARFAGIPPAETIEKKIKSERLKLLGDSQYWDAYRSAFAPLMANALSQGLFQDYDEVKSFFRDLELQSEPARDADGGLILKVTYYGRQRELGLTRLNILEANSDRELALKLMLAKIDAQLNASEKNRGSLPEFQSDWRLLRQLVRDNSPFLAGMDKSRGRFLKNPAPESVNRKLQKLVIAITH